jgi:hypothetical protein
MLVYLLVCMFGRSCRRNQHQMVDSLRIAFEVESAQVASEGVAG